MQAKNKIKKKKSTYELSQGIRIKRANLNALNISIKDKSIKKNKLIHLIDNDVDELTRRIKK